MPPKIKLNSVDSFTAENGLHIKCQLVGSACSLSQGRAQHGSSSPFPLELQQPLHFPLAMTALLEDTDLPQKKQTVINQSKKSHAEIVLISSPEEYAFLRNHVRNASGQGLQGTGYMLQSYRLHVRILSQVENYPQQSRSRIKHHTPRCFQESACGACRGGRWTRGETE